MHVIPKQIFPSLLCAVLLCAGTVASRTINVPSAGIASISQAVAQGAMGDTILVDRGIYRENVMLTPGMVLLSRENFGATIDGLGRGTAVTLGKNNTIAGFVIRNATIGIFTNGEGNKIRACRIVKNWQTGIITVRHLPVIEDNIIAFNRGSGIQGWDVRAVNGSINHNTLAFNGNNGIAIGGASELTIENNIFAFNERFGTKILPEAEKVKLVNNNFWWNLQQPGGVPKGNFAFDPVFVSPRMNFNFMSDPKLCCQIKGSDDENLGARLIY